MSALIAVGCRGDAPPKGLPPAGEWKVVPSAQGEAAPTVAAPKPAADGAGRIEDQARAMVTCWTRQLLADPVDSAHALGVFARHAPGVLARRAVVAVVAAIEQFPAGARAKVLGEAAWALASLGAANDAARVALVAVALPRDGQGGRITALATLGRIGKVDVALGHAHNVMDRDVVAFGAAVGGDRARAQALREEIEATPQHERFTRSAIHLKLVGALGDVPAITRALADRSSTSLLLDAGAVVEAGAAAKNSAVMKLGVIALTEVRGVPGRAQARALIGAAGTAGAADAREVVDLAIAAFDGLPAAARAGLELVPAVVFGNVGALDEARRRYAAAAPSSDPVDRAMIGAGLAALAGAWSDLPPQIPESPVLTADVWARALAATVDDATRDRVLAALCPAR